MKRKLTDTLRNSMDKWKSFTLKTNEHKCCITGKPYDIIHHKYPFSKIVEETFEELDIKRKEYANDYNNEELDMIKSKCLELHFKYGAGACLTKKMHDTFHDIYGKDFTISDFDEFVLNIKESTNKIEQISLKNKNEYIPYIFHVLYKNTVLQCYEKQIGDFVYKITTDSNLPNMHDFEIICDFINIIDFDKAKLNKDDFLYVRFSVNKIIDQYGTVRSQAVSKIIKKSLMKISNVKIKIFDKNNNIRSVFKIIDQLKFANKNSCKSKYRYTPNSLYINKKIIKKIKLRYIDTGIINLIKNCKMEMAKKFVLMFYKDILNKKKLIVTYNELYNIFNLNNKIKTKSYNNKRIKKTLLHLQKVKIIKKIKYNANFVEIFFN